MPPKSRKGLYVGRAGQLLVMSQLLARGWNTAIPEVDVGDDIFVVRDRRGEFIRVQVKTRIVKELKAEGAYSADFNIDLKQLRAPFTQQLIYIFVSMSGGECRSALIITQDTLLELYSEQDIGYTYSSKSKTDK